jgi:hypothetical protein
MARLLAGLVVLGFAAPAAACINDEESPKHEQEFRSQYPPVVDGEFPYEDALKSSPGSGYLLGGGSALLTVSLMMAFWQNRTRNQP